MSRFFPKDPCAKRPFDQRFKQIQSLLQEMKDKLVPLLDQIVSTLLHTHPIYAQYFGLEPIADYFVDYSEQGYNHCHAQLNIYQSILQDLIKDSTDPSETLEYRKVLTAISNLQLASNEYHFCIPSTHLTGLVPTLVNIKKFVVLESAKHIDWFSRCLENLECTIDGMINCFRIGIERKITLPLAALDRLLALITNTDIAACLDYSEYLKPLNIAPDYLSRIIESKVKPAWNRLEIFLDIEYRNHATLQPCISPQHYKELLHHSTTIATSAEAVLECATTQVEQIQKAMQNLQTQLGNDTNLKSFFHQLNSKDCYPELYKLDTLDQYQWIVTVIESEMLKYFSNFHYKKCQVEQVEANIDATAWYEFGRANTPGRFLINSHKLQDTPSHCLISQVAEHCIPGHQYQISILKETHPHPFYTLTMSSAFVQGWAGYSTFLVSEMGMYEDKLQHYGQLQGQLLVAVRAVVDARMHSQAWSRQQAMEYMQSILYLSSAKLEAIIDEILVFPGHAQSALYGTLQFQNLYKRAKSSLNQAFDFKKFHAIILKNGAITLPLLEQITTDWIQPKYSEPSLYKIHVFPQQERGFQALCFMS
jgi:uncharacterized protein (DUF885 family)